MKNKIIGIFICMLFLLSTIPLVTSATIDKNKERPRLLINNIVSEVKIGIVYGLIVFNGEELYDGVMCYNVTPINVKVIAIGWKSGEGWSGEYGKITSDPLYVPQYDLWHKFVGKHFMFLCLLEF